MMEDIQRALTLITWLLVLQSALLIALAAKVSCG